MTEIVPPEAIEQIVGVRRHPTQHIGRAISAEQRMYILHSQECRDSGIDLRACPYSQALDLGLNEARWSYSADQPVRLAITGGGDLAPVVQVQRCPPRRCAARRISPGR